MSVVQEILTPSKVLLKNIITFLLAHSKIYLVYFCKISLFNDYFHNYISCLLPFLSFCYVRSLGT